MTQAQGPRPSRLSRTQIADRLDEAAELLEAQGADRFRVRAYRQAAGTIRSLDEDPGEILARDGLPGLIALPTVGERIARAIDEMATTGRWMQLERLRGATDPERVLQTVPGIGPRTATLVHNELQIETLEALEIAAHDGRLEALPGIGPRRAAVIRGALAEMLARRRRRGPDDHEEPPVSLLLETDALYRSNAAAGRLRTIAPRRFNPDGRAWLPIMHIEADDWEISAMYSNTALAHQLSRTGDWVVLYFSRPGGPEHQRTIVTETRGPLQSLRVVRGREAECRRYHASREGNAALAAESG